MVMTFLQVRIISDVTGMIDQILALLPNVMRIIGFVLLLMLVIRAAKTYKSLSVTEMATIVIAVAIVFALMGKG